MTSPIEPRDLKVGDVVDVTLTGLLVERTDGPDLCRVSFSQGGFVVAFPSDWLSNATITRSPEVIEAGDVVRLSDGHGNPRRVLHVHEGRAWVEQACQGDYPVQSVRDLTLISKGAKS